MLPTLVLAPALFFASAGTLRWPMGWVHVLLLLTFTLRTRHPDLLVERGGFIQAQAVKRGDRSLVLVIGQGVPAAVAVGAGSDHRFDWPPGLPETVQVIGLACVVGGTALGTWAMLSNRCLSAVVRIQADWGQQVVTTGPYRSMRLRPTRGASSPPLGCRTCWSRSGRSCREPL